MKLYEGKKNHNTTWSVTYKTIQKTHFPSKNIELSAQVLTC